MAVVLLDGYSDAQQDHGVAQDVVLPRNGGEVLAQRVEHLHARVAIALQLVGGARTDEAMLGVLFQHGACKPARNGKRREAITTSGGTTTTATTTTTMTTTTATSISVTATVWPTRDAPSNVASANSRYAMLCRPHINGRI